MITEVKDEKNPFLFNLEYSIDNEIVGFLNYTFMYDRIEIEDIFVEEDYRRNSIASKLMDYLINKAYELNSINITLEVDNENISARSLYKKYGFAEVALRKGYYQGSDGILMEKKIRGE